MLLLVIVAVGSYYAARFLLEGFPQRRQPDDDPDFLRDLDRKRRHPEDPDT